MKTKQVIQFVQQANWAGIEVVVFRLATALRDLGIDSAVWCMGQGLLTQHLQNAGIAYKIFPFTSKFDLATTWQLRRALQAQHVQVLHTHGQRAMLLGNPAAKSARVPAIVTTFHTFVHMTGEVIPAYKLYGRIEGLLGRYATDCCVAYTESARRDAIQMRGVPPSKVKTIYNGVDLAQFSPMQNEAERARARADLGLLPNDFVIGAVGRLAPLKGHIYLLDALPLVRKQMPHAKIVLVGDGSQRAALEERIKTLGLESAVILLGGIPTTREIYSTFDTFVFPSVEGAFGVVILEAMACGIPVIATRLDGTDELITNGTNALLVSPRAPDEIANAVLRLAQNRALGEQLTRAAHTRIENDFSASAMARHYLELYDSILSRKGVA